MYYHLNHLYDLSMEEIEACFNTLQENITYLDLASNLLGNRNPVDLERLMRSLKINLTGLSLRQNNLGSMTPSGLEQFFSGFSRSLKTLDLSQNEFSNFMSAALINAFEMLPALTSLDLGKTGLMLMPLETSLLFKTIKPGLEFIGLSSNALGRCDGGELEQIFSAIPEGVRSVDLINNFLGSRHRKTSFEELINAIYAMPKTVEYIDFRDNGFGCIEISRLIDELPPNIKSIGIGSHQKLRLNSTMVDTYLTYELMYQVFMIVNNHRDNAFEAIKLPTEIQEHDLNRYIPLLEKQNTSIAFLVCALLLEGRINNSVEKKDDYAAYSEKRIHDAISFYDKAAQESHEIVKLQLQKLEKSSTIPSIHRRLAQYEMFHSKASHDKKEGIKILLANEARLFHSAVGNKEKQIVLYTPVKTMRK